MMDGLALPGTIPGLLRRCSPVVVTLSRRTYMGYQRGKRGVLGTLDRRAVWNFDPDDSIHGGYVRQSEVGLDLTDKTGRAHAAWWLAQREGFEHAGRGLFWYAATVSHQAVLHLEGCSSECRWHAFELEAQETGQNWSPTLKGLDPNDPRTLPDGSRWVDAEALRLVCLHVWEGQ